MISLSLSRFISDRVDGIVPGPLYLPFHVYSRGNTSQFLAWTEGIIIYLLTIMMLLLMIIDDGVAKSLRMSVDLFS